MKPAITCFLAAFVMFAGTLSAAAQQGSGGSYLIPDDGSSELFSNVAGTTNKVLTLHPKANSDDTFTVEVYDPATGTVLDSVEYTPGNEPSITVPPGAKARGVDPEDGNTKDPTGTKTVT